MQLVRVEGLWSVVVNWFHRTLCLWDASLLVWVVGALRPGLSVYRESQASRLSHAVPLTVAAVLFTPAVARYAPWLTMRVGPGLGEIGFAIALLGITSAISARLVLGRFWSNTVSLKQDHRLVQTGPFAWVRHPITRGSCLPA
jgi:protein-S-isoprenylcysteine O-methyltransferase Ste14